MGASWSRVLVKGQNLSPGTPLVCSSQVPVPFSPIAREHGLIGSMAASILGSFVPPTMSLFSFLSHSQWFILSVIFLFLILIYVLHLMFYSAYHSRPVLGIGRAFQLALEALPEMDFILTG